MMVIGVVLIIRQLVCAISVGYHYEQEIGYNWALADKSSTIAAKEEHIAKFVSAIESKRDKFADYNAIFLKTPDNCLSNNLVALKTLADRLHDISKMDETSFAYQTAIQQITAQEQGEASELISVIRGCYVLSTSTLVWSWIGLVVTIFCLVLMFAGGIFIAIFC